MERCDGCVVSPFQSMPKLRRLVQRDQEVLIDLSSFASKHPANGATESSNPISLNYSLQDSAQKRGSHIMGYP